MNRPESRICHNPRCGYTARQAIKKCPKCGRNMMTDGNFRLLGYVLAGLGFILAGIGSVVLWYLISNVNRLSGGTGGRIFAFGVVGLVAAMGFTMIFAGLWQAIFGNANRLLVFGFAIMAGTFLLIGAIVRYLD